MPAGNQPPLINARRPSPYGYIAAAVSIVSIGATVASPSAAASAGMGHGGYLYRYDYSWRLHPVTPFVTDELAMRLLRLDPNAYFPFEVVPIGGGPPSILQGRDYDLLGPLLPGLGIEIGSNPVRVIAADTRSFTFSTLPGHFDLPGSIIQFFTDESNGWVRLHQHAIGYADNEFLAIGAQNGGAKYAWSMMAQSLGRDLYNPLLSNLDYSSGW